MPYTTDKLRRRDTPKVANVFLALALLVGSVFAFQRINYSFRSSAAVSSDTWLVGNPGPSFAGIPAGKNLYRTAIHTGGTASRCMATHSQWSLYSPRFQKTYVLLTSDNASYSPTPPDGVKYTSINPKIISFNHATNTWDTEVSLPATWTSTTASDCHYGPSLVIDNSGRIHVFYSYHANNMNIRHFISASTNGSIATTWSSSEIPNTRTSTYATPVIDQAGEIYVFYRDTVFNGWTNQSTYRMYEPEKYVKYSNGSWSGPRTLVEPGYPTGVTPPAGSELNDTGWNTIYVSDVRQDTQSRDKLYFTFAINSNHTLSQHWYLAAFDMASDRVCAVDGTCLQSLAPLKRSQFINNNLYKLWNNEVEDKTYSTPLVYIENGTPVVIHTDLASTNPVFFTLKQSRWNPSLRVWDSRLLKDVLGKSTDPFGRITSLFDVTRRSDGTLDISVKTMEDSINLKSYSQFSAITWPQDQIYNYPAKVFNVSTGGSVVASRTFSAGEYSGSFTNQDHRSWEVRGMSSFVHIIDSHPAIRYVGVVPKYTTNVYKPEYDPTRHYALGAFYVFGDTALTTASTGVPVATPVPATPTPRPPTPTSPPAPTPTPVPPAAQNLYSATGSLDLATHNRVSGWAKDPDYTGPIDVHIYLDGVIHKITKANVYRADVGNYAFDATITIPATGSHRINVYGIGVRSDGSATGYNPELGNSPRYVTYPAPVPLSCTSFTNLSINGCTSSAMNLPQCTTSSRTPNVNFYTTSDPNYVTVYQLQEFPSATYCTSAQFTVPSLTYSSAVTMPWTFTSSGSKKLCIKFTRAGQSAVCGGVVNISP